MVKMIEYLLKYPSSLQENKKWKNSKLAVWIIRHLYKMIDWLIDWLIGLPNNHIIGRIFSGP